MSESTFQYDFFIAHAGANKDEAENLFDLLSPHRVFLDTRCLKLGDDWDLELRQAQRESRITVVLVSSRTQAAYYQREEIAAAINMARKEGHRVIPLYLDGWPDDESQIPFGLRLKHGLSIPETNGLYEVAQRLKELIIQLKNNLSASNAPDSQKISPDDLGVENLDIKQPTAIRNTKSQERVKPRPEYFCYISRDKIDQLYDDLSDELVSNARFTEKHIVPIQELVNSDVSYGRADVLQAQANLKRAYAQKLKTVLLTHADNIEPFDWSIKTPDVDNIFYWIKASFSVKDIDENQMMAKVLAKKGKKDLVLYCSLKYFSAGVAKEGHPFFHSTNYAFFNEKLAVTFESVFYLLSAKGNKFYGSPLYLKLSPMTGLLL